MTSPDNQDQPRSIRDRWDDVEVDVTQAPETPPPGPPLEEPDPAPQQR